jgi:hypothetical protein
MHHAPHLRGVFYLDSVGHSAYYIYISAFQILACC